MSGKLTGIAVAIRIAKGQEALAAKVGVTQQAVSQWLKQGYVPTERIKSVLEAVGPTSGIITARDLLDPSVRQLVDEKPKY